VSGSTDTGTLTASGSITGGEIKIGNESTSTSAGIFVAGRTKTFYPSPSNSPYTIQKLRGLELFWNTVPDTSIYTDFFAGDSTFMNYAGGGGQRGGYSFQTTPGDGTTPSANPTVLFEMVKGKNFTINGGIHSQGEITIANGVAQQSVKLAFTNNEQVGWLPNSNKTLKLYHSAVGAYSYKNAHPLVIKDFSLTAVAIKDDVYHLPTEQQLVFPMSECIYVDISSNDLNLILPDINTLVGNVDPKSQIFRFKIRQIKESSSRFYHIRTYNNNSSGGALYNSNNVSLGYYTTPGVTSVEVHFYLGNRYIN
jgi:hypothetical protein